MLILVHCTLRFTAEWLLVCSAIPPLLMLQVRFAEAVDRMLAHLVRRLWEAEEAAAAAGDDGEGDGGRSRQYDEAVHVQPGQRYCLAVTGSGSTPAMSGKALHEPVPFAIAHVRHVVRRGR